MIEVAEITKRFGDRTIVRDFSTRVMRGDRVGIVGPNGCDPQAFAARTDRLADAKDELAAAAERWLDLGAPHEQIA